MGNQQPQQSQQTPNTKQRERQSGPAQDSTGRQPQQTQQDQDRSQAPKTANEAAEDDSASINESSNQKGTH
jgi:hypothetical protein